MAKVECWIKVRKFQKQTSLFLILLKGTKKLVARAELGKYFVVFFCRIENKIFLF